MGFSDWFDRILGAGESIYSTVNPPAGYHVENGRLVPDVAQFNTLIFAGLAIVVVVLLVKR